MTLDEMIGDAATSDGPSAVPTSPVSPGGVDPLGLRQINFGLMDQVFPNLNNVAHRLRPFMVLAWAWRRVGEIVRDSGQGGDTDERMRDFVDRIEAIYSWSQFLIDPSSDLPGSQALQPLLDSESYRFGGEAWFRIRNLRRSSTGLISPLNYGPGVKLMGWLEPVVGPRGVFRPNPALDSALDAFEDAIRDELGHAAFCTLGEVTVLAEDVRRWGALWSLDSLTRQEREAGFERLAGEDAPAERRDGIMLVRAAYASIKDPDAGAEELRRWMAETLSTSEGDTNLGPVVVRWRKVQVRQVFRLALEGLLYWLVGELGRGPRESSALARAFLSAFKEHGDLPDAAAWLDDLQVASDPVDHLESLREALATGTDVPRSIAGAIAFCLREKPGRPEAFERSDRLPLTRAADQARAWTGLSPDQFMVKVIEVWVLAQHAYWCVGRGLADARGGRRKLLRLKVVMDEGGWTLTPGTSQKNPPVATPDRLGSVVGLLSDCGRLP